jgi:hypothetical protein
VFARELVDPQDRRTSSPRGFTRGKLMAILRFIDRPDPGSNILHHPARSPFSFCNKEFALRTSL